MKHAAPPLLHTVRSGVPKALGKLIARCLAKDAADRPASYEELAHALRPFLTTGAPARLDMRLVAGAADLLIVSIPAGLLNSTLGPAGARRGSTAVELDPFTASVPASAAPASNSDCSAFG